MAKELTEDQRLFLKALFGTAEGNMKSAAKASIGTEDYQSLLNDALMDAIRKRSDQELCLNAARATFVLSKIITDPDSVIYSDRVAKVCSDILDRVGLAKKEREGGGQTIVGIVMLPSKMPIPEPPALEGVATALEGPILKLPVLEIKDGIPAKSS